VTYSTYLEKAANIRPKARATVVRSGTTVSLDASSSRDRDGTIASYSWYVETATNDQVLTGRKATATLPENKPASVTLVVTDNRGLTDFYTLNVPGIKQTSPPAGPSDPVTIALLSSPDLQAPSLKQLRWGPNKRRAADSEVTTQDVNGDGRADLLLTDIAGELGLKVGRQIVCAVGALPDGNPFRSCVPVTLAAESESTDGGGSDPGNGDDASQDSGSPTDQPGVQAETLRGTLAGSGGPSWLLLGGGALLIALAAGVLVAARRHVIASDGGSSVASGEAGASPRE
jgi:hypothetical protein